MDRRPVWLRWEAVALAWVVGLVLMVPSFGAAPRDFTLKAAGTDSSLKLTEAGTRYVALHFLLRGDSDVCALELLSYAARAADMPEVLHVFIKPDTDEEATAWREKIAASRPGNADPSFPPPVYIDPDAGLAKAYGIPFGLEFQGQMVHFPTLILVDSSGAEVQRYEGKSAEDRVPVERFMAGLEQMASSSVDSHFNVGDKGLALKGYDPVAYLKDGRAEKGDPGKQLKYKGMTFYFSSQVNRTAFAAAPEKYLPAYGGWSAVHMATGEKVDINPRTFRVAGGRLFLFSSGVAGLASPLKIWEKKETELIEKADANWARITGEKR